MLRVAFVSLALASPLAAAEPAPPPRAVSRPASAVIESSLATGNNQIRQFAFDGDPDTLRTVSGREIGELLRLTRDEHGTVVRIHWATYRFTRSIETFDRQTF